MGKMRRVRISGLVSFGMPLQETDEVVEVPARLIEPHESVYRIAGDFQHFYAGDLIVIEHRTEIATGELVLVTSEGKAYIGNWWGKHKKKELIVDPALAPLRNVQIIGVINQVIRHGQQA